MLSHLQKIPDSDEFRSFATRSPPSMFNVVVCLTFFWVSPARGKNQRSIGSFYFLGNGCSSCQSCAFNRSAAAAELDHKYDFDCFDNLVVQPAALAQTSHQLTSKLKYTTSMVKINLLSSALFVSIAINGTNGFQTAAPVLTLG